MSPENGNDDQKETDESAAHLAGISDQQMEAYRQKILACFGLATGAPQAPSNASELGQILVEHRRWIRSVIDANGSLVGTRANLRGASLRGARLAGTDLRGADLQRADLTGADLQGCNLAMADLSHANLTGALLKGSVLTGTKLNGADLSAVDLSDVIRA